MDWLATYWNLGGGEGKLHCFQLITCHLNFHEQRNQLGCSAARQTGVVAVQHATFLISVSPFPQDNDLFWFMKNVAAH